MPIKNGSHKLFFQLQPGSLSKKCLVCYISCHNGCTGQVLFEIEQLNNFKINHFS